MSWSNYEILNCFEMELFVFEKEIPGVTNFAKYVTVVWFWLESK